MSQAIRSGVCVTAMVVSVKSVTRAVPRLSRPRPEVIVAVRIMASPSGGVD